MYLEEYLSVFKCVKLFLMFRFLRSVTKKLLLRMWQSTMHNRYGHMFLCTVARTAVTYHYVPFLILLHNSDYEKMELNRTSFLLILLYENFLYLKNTLQAKCKIIEKQRSVGKDFRAF